MYYRRTVSQSQASEWLSGRGTPVCGWHHSHPRFPPAPSAQDLRSQRAVQALRARRPLVALISSQGWAPGRRASLVRYVCSTRSVETATIKTMTPVFSNGSRHRDVSLQSEEMEILNIEIYLNIFNISISLLSFLQVEIEPIGVACSHDGL